MSSALSPEFHQVLYVSRSRIDDLGDIRRLHDICKRNNARLALTGVLLYTGGHFAQLLEGSPQAMGEVMWRIAHDERHTRMRKLFTKPMTRRACTAWAMKLVIADDADDQVRQLVEAAQPAIHEAAALLGRMQDLGTRARSVA